MAKDIQIKYINDQQEWEELYPVTKTRIVEDESGQKLDMLLQNKVNKNEVYTSLEIDTKLSDIDDVIGNLKQFNIPVQAEEPTDEKFWFEIV